MFKKKKKIQQNMYEPKKMEDSNVIDPYFPEDIVSFKTSKFTIRKSLGLFMTCVLTLGALLAYVPYVVKKEEQQREFEASHVMAIETYVTLITQRYQKTEANKAIDEYRLLQLEQMSGTHLAIEELLQDTVTESTAKNIQVGEIEETGDNMYRARVRFQHLFSTTVDGLSQTYNKTMEFIVSYYQRDTSFYVINRHLIFKEDTPILDNDTKQMLEKSQLPIIDGQPLEAEETEIVAERLKKFFQTLSENEESAIKLVKKGVILPHYYHGTFDVESMKVEAVEDEDGLTIVTVNIVYSGIGFKDAKTIVIWMDDNTITDFKEIGNM